MSGIKDFGGFGNTASTEEETEGFESSTAGGNGQTDDSTPRDDHSDNAGWDQETDVKSIEGVGKEPAKEEDKGTGVDKEKLDGKDKTKEPDKKGDEDKGEDDDDTDKGDDLPEGVKRRVARANRARDREKERADAAEKEAAELRKQIEEKPKADAEPPKADDFDDYEDYLQAKKDFEAKPKPKAEEKPADDKPQGKPDRELVGAVKEIEATLADAGHGDLFKQVVESKDVDVTRDMAIAIAELDNPETVLQAFLDDPALSKSIADLKTPTARLKALLKLDVPYVKPDAKKADDPADKKPAPKKGSDAPDPIDETNGNAHGDTGYEGLSFREFEEKRNSEVKRSKTFW